MLFLTTWAHGFPYSIHLSHFHKDGQNRVQEEVFSCAKSLNCRLFNTFIEMLIYLIFYGHIILTSSKSVLRWSIGGDPFGFLSLIFYNLLPVKAIGTTCFPLSVRLSLFLSVTPYTQFYALQTKVNFHGTCYVTFGLGLSYG